MKKSFTVTLFRLQTNYLEYDPSPIYTLSFRLYLCMFTTYKLYTYIIIYFISRIDYRISYSLDADRAYSKHYGKRIENL